MGCEPLGLMAPGKVQTWLPDHQGTPRPQTLVSLPNKTTRQPCSVRVVEAVAGAVETFAKSFTGSLGPGPARP
eukprot:1144934-Pelagomonas_calceolata.AAC.2